MSIALTYEMRGRDERIPVLIVVIVSIVVMPAANHRQPNFIS